MPMLTCRTARWGKRLANEKDSAYRVTSCGQHETEDSHAQNVPFAGKSAQLFLPARKSNAPRRKQVQEKRKGHRCHRSARPKTCRTPAVEEGNHVYDSRESCNAIIKTSTNVLIRGCKTTIIHNSVTKTAREQNIRPIGRFCRQKTSKHRRSSIIRLPKLAQDDLDLCINVNTNHE